MHDLKIIVIGAGIGGLSAGIALKRAGFRVEVYDRVRELRSVGAGISLWSNGVKVLNWLGLGPQVAAIGGPMRRMQYRAMTGELLNAIDLKPLVDAVGQCPYPVARADLQAMLLDAYAEPIVLNHRCIGVEETSQGVTAIFENGQRASGDLVVAADGIRSTLRTYVLGQETEPQYAGYVNWNGLTSAREELAPKDCWVIYVGNCQRASMMPVAGDRVYFFFDVPLPKGSPANPEDYKADLSKHFSGWAEPVQHLIAQLDPKAVARPEIHDVGPIERMVRGRVALLGDAAHATCPDLGQGGCQALEDSLVLTQYLTTTIGLDYALACYERDRKARTSAVVRKARQRAEMIHGKDPTITQQWYQQLAREQPTDVTNAIAKVILAGPLG